VAEASLVKKTVDELKGLLLESKKELFNLRFQKISGELANTSRVRLVRKNVARIKTALRQKTMESANA
jgi:large subunit ribosomal protein L29